MSVHTDDEAEYPLALVFDRRDGDYNTVVMIDIFSSLSLAFKLGNNPFQAIPNWKWVCQAMKSCALNRELLMEEWEQNREPP